jgi:pimeloyl-ACP methyl ester carboxylesterase
MNGLHQIGTRLYVKEEGSGEPLVLTHGLTLDLRMWALQIPALAREFRVIRYDLRCFGNRMTR